MYRWILFRFKVSCCKLDNFEMSLVILQCDIIEYQTVQQDFFVIIIRLMSFWIITILGKSWTAIPDGSLMIQYKKLELWAPNKIITKQKVCRRDYHFQYDGHTHRPIFEGFYLIRNWSWFPVLISFIKVVICCGSQTYIKRNSGFEWLEKETRKVFWTNFLIFFQWNILSTKSLTQTNILRKTKVTEMNEVHTKFL